MDKPVIFHQGSYTIADLERFQAEHRIWRVVDIYAEQLAELFEIEHPHQVGQTDFEGQRDEFVAATTASGIKDKGDWIYYPWSGILLHTMMQMEVWQLRTNRNQLLIDEEGQNHLTSQAVGFAGLSIGASYAASLAYSGIANRMKLADMDRLSTSNLNRVQAGLAAVGQKKVEIVAERIYEINPYQTFELFEDGLDRNNLNQFFGGDGDRTRLNLVFEAVDDFELKVRLRLKAKEHKVPLIMLTNLGDRILIDVERYDYDIDLMPFNGLLSQEVIDQILSGQSGAITKHIISLLGIDNLSLPIVESLNQIGSSLVGRPQLFGSVTIGGGLASYLSRQVFLGHTLLSGRYALSLDALVGIDSQEDPEQRQQAVDVLMKRAGL